MSVSQTNRKRPWLWVDIENTPHAHFLRPFVERLAARHSVEVTARPQAQTLALAEHLGLRATPIGSGDRRGFAGKVAGVVGRAAQLAWWAGRRGRPGALISCSRSACIAAKALGVPSFAILDYEHAELRALSLASAIWMPDVLRDVKLPDYARRVVRFFEGLKENLYLDAAIIDRAAERAALGITSDTRLVISRPPAETAHYASDKSWELWNTVTARLGGMAQTRVLIVPRTSAQGQRIRRELGAQRGVEILDRVIDGPRAIVAADLVVGGGGTINREGAVLGTPVWSVFSGPRPHVDEVLAHEGRLVWIDTLEAARTAAPPRVGERSRRGPYPAGQQRILAAVEAALQGAGS